MGLIWIIIPIFILYSILIVYYWRSWQAIPDFVRHSDSPDTSISIIIPARNEETNIGSLLSALENQNYPRHLFEIIVIDDHSEDKTAEIVRSFGRVKLLQL